MAFENLRTQAQVSSGASAEIDEGLRQHMLRVYNYMVAGLIVTGLVSFAMYNLAFVTEGGRVVAYTQVGAAIYGSPLKWVFMLLPLGLAFFLSARIHKMSFGATQIVYWIYAASFGIMLGTIFAMFSTATITRVFFITAGLFAFMSLWGYTTKRDLTKMGSFLIMGLFGVILASIVNIFIGSTAIQFATSVLVVVIATGLTAYDTQRIKNDFLEYRSYGEELGKLAVMGALALYMDFIMIFVNLLQLFGLMGGDE